MVNQKESKLTLIICTYNRADLLQECLQSIYNSPIQNKIKVLVIDNGSIDHTTKITTDFKSEWDNFEWVIEHKTGLSNARNKGLQQANTEWIGFIDDDAKIGPKFISIALEIIQNENYDCFGGTYYPWYKFGTPKWIKEEWFTKSILLDKRGKLEQGYLSGGVFFIKQAVLKKVNGFKPHLGMQGKEVKYGEEEVLQDNLRKLGHPIGYDPNLFIYHAVLPYKIKLNWRFKVSFAKGKRWQDFKNPSYLKVLNAFFLSCVGFLIKRLPSALFNLITKRTYYWQNALIDAFSPFSYYYGVIFQKIKHRKQKTKLLEGWEILKLLILCELPKIRFSTSRAFNSPALVFHFQNRPSYKYLYNLFALSIENRMAVYLIPSLSFYRYLDVYGKDFLKDLNYKILLFKPKNSNCFSDLNKKGYRKISYDYLSDMAEPKDDTYAFPLLLHPYHYKNQLHQTFDPSPNPKSIKLFFQGNTGQHYDTIYSNKYFGVPNRHETIAFLQKHFSPVQPTNASSRDLLKNPLGLLIINSKNNQIGEREYLQLLSSADYFLALPGFRAPTCHNVYEAVFCESIPIIHENLIPFYGKLLMAHQNCLVYSNLEQLKAIIQDIIDEKVSKQTKLLKSNLIETKQKYLEPSKVLLPLKNHFESIQSITLFYDALSLETYISNMTQRIGSSNNK